MLITLASAGTRILQNKQFFEINITQKDRQSGKHASVLSGTILAERKYANCVACV